MLAAVQRDTASWANGVAGPSCVDWQRPNHVTRCMRSEAARTKAPPPARHRLEPVLRCLCLAALNPLLDNVTNDTDLQLPEIDIRPFEAQ
jgi:hypothetical protein